MSIAISARDLYGKIATEALRFRRCLGSNFNFGQKIVPPTVL